MTVHIWSRNWQSPNAVDIYIYIYIYIHWLQRTSSMARLHPYSRELPKTVESSSGTLVNYLTASIYVCDIANMRRQIKKCNSESLSAIFDKMCLQKISRLNTRPHGHTLAHTHNAHTHTHTHTHIYICVCACACIYIYIYIYYHPFISISYLINKYFLIYIYIYIYISEEIYRKLIQNAL